MLLSRLNVAGTLLWALKTVVVGVVLPAVIAIGGGVA